MKLLKFCLSLAILSCLLTACGQPDAEPMDTLPQEIDLRIAGLDSAELTVIMRKSPVYDNDEEMAAYASELLADAGWDVEFIFFDPYDYDYDKASSAYQSLIMTGLAAGKNLVFENCGYVDIDELKKNRYLAKKEKGGYDWHRHLGRRREYSYQGIFIRRELDDLYGREIAGIEDYDRFLSWAKNNYLEQKPCLMVMQTPFHDGFNPISLFAQTSGYTKVDHAVSGLREVHSTIYMSDADMYNYMNETPDVYEAAELPFFNEMDDYLNKWYGNGFLKVIDYDDFDSTSGYSSIICSIRSSTDYYSKDYTRSHCQLLDVSGFNLHVLTAGETVHLSPYVYNRSRSSSFCFASENPAAEIGSAFLEWIYASTDNYLLFMFGKEGIDYNIVDGQLEFLANPNGLSYGEWIVHEKFIDDTMHPVMPHFPSNWAEVQHEFSQIEEFSIPGFGHTTTNEGTKVGSNEKVIGLNSLSAVDSGIYALYERYFMDIGKEGDRYTAWDLKVDIAESASARTRKENYMKILIYAGGPK